MKNLKSKMLCFGVVFTTFSIAQSAFAIRAIQDRFIKHYDAQIPEGEIKLKDGPLDSCATCHQPVIDQALNYYGLALKNNLLNFAALEADALDSDKDRVSNVDEILRDHSNPGSHAKDENNFVFTVCNKKVKQYYPDICKSSIIMPDVLFPHTKHVDDFGLGCSDCHYAGAFEKKQFDNITMNNNTRFMGHEECSDCHRISRNDPPLYPKTEAENEIHGNSCERCHSVSE